jgi:hypothetical protein
MTRRTESDLGQKPNKENQSKSLTRHRSEPTRVLSETNSVNSSQQQDSVDEEVEKVSEEILKIDGQSYFTCPNKFISPK